MTAAPTGKGKAGRRRVNRQTAVALSLMFMFGTTLAFANSAESDPDTTIRALMATDVGVGLALVAIVRYFSNRRQTLNRTSHSMITDAA